MGSSDTSINESEPRNPEFTNPLSLAFANLFGMGTAFNSDTNTYMLTGAQSTDPSQQTKTDWMGNQYTVQDGEFKQGNAQFANQIFTPDTFNALTDQLNPVTQGGGSQNVRSALDSFSGFSQDLAKTGFKTDIDPIRQQMLREFQQQTVPDLANQFSTLGGGGQNAPFSDFNQAAIRAGGDMFTNLGALDFQASESAADRRQQGLSFLGQMPGLESDALALQEQNFDFQLLSRPGGQLLNFFNNLMGVTQPDPLLLGNSSSGSRDAFSIL